ncbi:dimethylaniline monooxygenase, putative [Talaromyces stipitatus ATCC 10500]|uniref:Dimethylaniline monooxygenase, putative n=1 Tax=Talaromyces stipitatus (strain ATCC 10500 / CBS 375.48 / QM 6759 / NRRL 1006) TaxID=441959 RepID=B8ML37_TALSN|nr:dimethylaniline monooxygenase, putative [Talaromyces stipitatus ATCC 10500]EED15453.1 dimethylaniline monooxygenase, putative [Talaromyces stipitatus ATCC 10500]
MQLIAYNNLSTLIIGSYCDSELQNVCSLDSAAPFAMCMSAMEVDVAVIGAGLTGIAFARFYLDIHPEARLVIFEKDADIGGVWSAERVFEAFWAQSPLRMTSLADVALDIPDDAPRAYGTFEAKYVTKYLKEYVDSHVYNGESLRSRIRVNADVRSVEKHGDGWLLHIKGTEPQSWYCKKLAVASGLTSLPNMPTFPLSSDCKFPMLHHRDLGAHEKILEPDSAYRNITVIGGGKSAADMVYGALKKGKNVNWIIRTSGEGPGIFMDPAASGRYKHAAEAGATQKAATLSPSFFHELSGTALSLHQNESARASLEEKLYAADHRFKAWANYRGREGALPGFRDLEPKASFFWSSGPIGVIQQDDFWDLVSKNVHVYRGDPCGTTSDAIILMDGREVPTDVALCGTGWNSSYPFFTNEQASQLGLPHQPSASTEDQTWKDLIKQADAEILRTYPILGSPPTDAKFVGGDNLTPARLYNGMASLSDPSILFLGRARMSNNFRAADAQAIWATAYWDGHVTLPPLGEAKRQVAYMNALSRRRYPTRGADGVNFHADLVYYTDKLACEAGLSSHRKGWWNDPEEPCLASDFRGCTEEYRKKYC